MPAIGLNASVNENPRWSSSRFSTYQGCMTKYYIQYIRQLVVEGRDSDLAQKGLAFHQIAEQMDSSKSIDDLLNIAKRITGEMEIDEEKYPVVKAIPRFYAWWMEYIQPLENAGYTLTKEHWENSKILGKPLTGAMDLLLINETTKDVIIIDFKTGSQAKIAGYENQLMLYATMIGRKLDLKTPDIPSKIKTYLYFPLAGLKGASDEKIAKDAGKIYKQLIYSEDDLIKLITDYEKIVVDSETKDWDNFEYGSEENCQLSFSCSWCGVCGHPRFCKASYNAGLKFPRKAKIYVKGDEEKKPV